MESNFFNIKNMVCERCILSVTEILERLEIPFRQVTLGEVILNSSLDPEKRTLLKSELQQVGFELIDDKNEKLVNKIKSIIIEGIYTDSNFSNKNLSFILSEKLHFDYSYISSLFSKVEGKSIKQFQQEIKTERVKELLEYDELNISEIALDLGYSSAAYLSTQFKRSTGFTPSQYKFQHLKARNPLDKV